MSSFSSHKPQTCMCPQTAIERPVLLPTIQQPVW